MPLALKIQVTSQRFNKIALRDSASLRLCVNFFLLCVLSVKNPRNPRHPRPIFNLQLSIFNIQPSTLPTFNLPQYYSFPIYFLPKYCTMMLYLPFYLPGRSFLQQSLSDCPHRSTGQRSAPAGPQPLLPTSAAAGVRPVQSARCVADRQPVLGMRICRRCPHPQGHLHPGPSPPYY